MVVGSGLIAKTFKKYSDSKSYLIFASGVSDSTIADTHHFDRELDLIKRYVNVKSKFIYFSTSNIGYSPYHSHKKKMESFIQQSFDDYLIIRIPNIVGIGGNQNNIFNFFKKKIMNEEKISVYDDFRSLMDVEDLLIIFDGCSHLRNEIIDFSYIEKMKVIEIVKMISENLGIDPIIEMIKREKDNDDIENSEIAKDIIRDKICVSGYTSRLIDKYIPKI